MKFIVLTKEGHQIIERNTLDLHQIHEILDVDLIDIVDIRGYSFIVDDEGLLKQIDFWSVFADNYQLAGRALVTKYDENGENIGLTDKDISAFWERFVEVTANTETCGDFRLCVGI